MTFVAHLFIKGILFIAILAVLSGFSNAATALSLTGGCSHTFVNGSTNYITFNLANNGNSAATNLTVTPELSGALTYNPIESLPSIDSGKSATIDFYLYNFSPPGSYAEGFIVQYTQAGATRLAVFPCLLDISQQTQSGVSFTQIGFLNGDLTATMLNLGGTLVYANVSLLAPAGFTIVPEISSVNIRPGSFADANFNILFPQNALFINASYLIVVTLSYTQSNIHYATYNTILIRHPVSSNEIVNPTTIPANQISGPAISLPCIIYLSLRSIAFIIGLFLVLLGGLMYALSHIGNETLRGRLQDYGTNIIVGGIALIALIELLPYILTLIADGIFQSC